jgi:predicted nucleic acid-binding protein
MSASCQEKLDAIALDLSAPVKQETIRLRIYRLCLPDAIVAATALHLGVTLLTNDRDLLGVSEIAPRSLRLK